MLKTGLWFMALGQRIKYRISQRMTRVAKPEVLVATSFADIVTRLAYGQKYKADGRRDRMLHPRKMQARIYAGDARLGDCEDHAAYWIACLIKSRLADEVFLGNIQYRRQGERQGHAVVVFQVEGEWYWADYGMPIAITDRDLWHASVLDLYGDALLGAVLTHVELNSDDTVNFNKAILYPKE